MISIAFCLRWLMLSGDPLVLKRGKRKVVEVHTEHMLNGKIRGN